MTSPNPNAIPAKNLADQDMLETKGIRHCEDEVIEDVLNPQNNQNSSYHFLEIFGNNPDDNYTYRVIKTIDDALCNRRPDLDIAIWTAISLMPQNTLNPKEGAFDKPYISPLAYDILKSTGLNVGVMLLLAIIHHKEAIFLEGLKFTSIDGKSYLWIDLTETGKGTRIYVPNYQISKEIEWAGTKMIVPLIPETILIKFHESPLRDLISHPAFDKHELIIKRTSQEDGKTCITTNYMWDEYKDLNAGISLYELAAQELARLKSAA